MAKWVSGGDLEENIKDYDSGKVFAFFVLSWKRPPRLFFYTSICMVSMIAEISRADIRFR